jgi:hypothetical protein
MDVQFPHEPGAVGLGGFRTDAQQAGNVFGGLSFTNQLKDLSLSRG